MNANAETLSDASRKSADPARDAERAARNMNWRNTRAPRNQPRTSNPGTPGPVATNRSRSSGFKPAMLAGGLTSRMLDNRENTAVVSANAAMAAKEPRSCHKADTSSSAIHIVVDAANQAVTGWRRRTLEPHPIMT